MSAGIPLAGIAAEMLERLAKATGSAAIAALDGASMLGERAALLGMTIPGAFSTGGCRLLPALGDTIALNLARPTDRDLLPALFEDGTLDLDDDAAIATCVARSDAAALVARGRMFGLAIAAMHEQQAAPRPAETLASGLPATSARRRHPRVLDLSALWAGPLAAHLLWLAGADVIKVESRTRPDAMRDGQPAFYAMLNQGKASLALDLRDHEDRQVLLTLIADADIVIEAARPRALLQLGIDASAIVRATPGLVWLTITGHGATGEAADWIGFGDDVGVAAGLSAALHDATGHIGFVGDAIADPLTGLHAALAGSEAWSSGQGGRIGVAMRDVAAASLAAARTQDGAAFEASLMVWAGAVGHPFLPVRGRSSALLPAFASAAPRWTASC